ncbi:mutator family transposase [Nonomuraea fuscirosea]|uniref:Mutator family transposase n=1 Tax=Nonomuraea fuscirosea TaxID=1291556 RepID=A0A2T0LK63_9ACTN|nr:mutator family transposase [Nonomuraea fuscirosea]
MRAGAGAGRASRRRPVGHDRAPAQSYQRAEHPDGAAGAAASRPATIGVDDWKKIWSIDLLEQLNKEIKRRADVVGVFPTPEALLRLAGAVLVEAHDEWQVTDRRYLSKGFMALITTSTTDPQEVAHTELMTT